MINSSNICPFNFDKFTSLNAVVGNVEASLLISKIKFHQQLSSFKQDGDTWAILTRKQIAGWFGYSLDKTDKLLNILMSKGLISKKAILWHGIKKLIITVHGDNYPAFNFNLFEDLTKQAGSIKAALLFSHIAFRFANSIIKHQEMSWCCINKDVLANWSNSSIRTIDSILKTLMQKGLINKSLFAWNNKSQTHFNIPTAVIESLQKHWNKVQKTTQNTNTYKQANRNIPPTVSNNLVKINPVNQPFCRSQPAKKPLSIIKNTNIKKNSNNTCDINFSNSKLNVIGNELTYRQVQYLKGAIKKIKSQKNLTFSNPTELEEWVKFSILQETQRYGITSFKHAVSRFMMIISDNRYNMPIGFSKYSAYGIKANEHKHQQEQQWQDLKEIEMQRNTAIDFDNVLQSKNNFTEQAMNIARKMVDLSKVEVGATTENAIANMMNNLSNKINELVGQGANVKIVRGYLQKNISNKPININNIAKAA